MKKALYIAFILSLCSCVNTDINTDQSLEDTLQENDSTVNDYVEIIDEIIYESPSAFEIVEVFKDAGITYDKTLLHPKTEVGAYISFSARSLNTGIFLSDLAYSSFFGQQQHSLHISEAIISLCDKLNIKSGYEQELLKKMQSGLLIENDSLIYYTQNLNLKITEYLLANNREELLAAISAGIFIESLYIALNNINDYHMADALIQAIADQKYTFDILSEQYSQYKHNPVFSQINPELQELEKVFTLVVQKSNEDTQVNQKSGTISLSGGVELLLNEETYHKLKTTVIKFRTKIINLE